VGKRKDHDLNRGHHLVDITGNFTGVLFPKLAFYHEDKFSFNWFIVNLDFFPLKQNATRN
jgi:hypothetical protein